MSDHSIVHLEIPAKDTAAGAKFYADLFGWKLQVEPSFDYHMFQADPGPGGGFVKVGEGPGGGFGSYKAGEILVYVSTDDINASLAKVEALGGKTLVAKTEIPHQGWFAIFSDPTGNRVALYTAMEHH